MDRFCNASVIPSKTMNARIPIITTENVIIERLRFRKTLRNANLNIIPMAAPPLLFPFRIGMYHTVFEYDKPVSEVHDHAVVRGENE